MSIEKAFISGGKTRLGIERFLKSEIDKIGYSGIDVQKTPLSTRIVLRVEKPPLVIGRKGDRINKLTTTLREKFGIEDPMIDVQGVENPYLDANIVAREIATSIEKGMDPRRVARSAVDAVMNHGATGIQIILSGKLVGKGERGRTEKFHKGYMKKSGDPFKSVRVGKVQTLLKQGVIGVVVRILPPNIRFPDDITIKEKEPEVKEIEIKPTAVKQTAEVKQTVVKQAEEKKEVREEKK